VALSPSGQRADSLADENPLTLSLYRLHYEQTRVSTIIQPLPPRRDYYMTAAKPSLKILLVDDNKIACKSTAVLLEMGGHQVRTALSGGAALEIAQDYQPDAVIMDIKLPDMNGYELLKKLKSLEKLSSTKFIAVTGYDQAAVYPNDRHVTFHHFLQKPVDATDLETLLLSQSSPA
jgi:two-component system OmpR family response regulator